MEIAPREFGNCDFAHISVREAPQADSGTRCWGVERLAQSKSGALMKKTAGYQSGAAMLALRESKNDQAMGRRLEMLKSAQALPVDGVALPRR